MKSLNRIVIEKVDGIVQYVDKILVDNKSTARHKFPYKKAIPFKRELENGKVLEVSYRIISKEQAERDVAAYLEKKENNVKTN